LHVLAFELLLSEVHEALNYRDDPLGIYLLINEVLTDVVVPEVAFVASFENAIATDRIEFLNSLPIRC